ncbi:MAG: DegV family protein [Lachnospiraceae bacterium]|nr:DegV family protein [Lachnospiraceae bacterium]
MIRLYTDSTCDLTKEMLQENNITMVPLYVSLGDELTGRDGVEITPDKIYEWADRAKDTPKTAAFSPDDIMAEIEKCKKNGDDMLYIGIATSMSGTNSVVRLAAEELEYEDHVYVVDSKNLSTGIGLILLKAAKLIRDGVSAAGIETILTGSVIPQVRASFIVDTLTYLHRGGRCSAVTALLANTLKLKPKIVVTDGKMDVGSKYRGDLKKVLLKYTNDMKEELLNAERDMVFITHSGVDEQIVESVRKYLEDLDYFEHIEETRAGAVISSHCGPGTLGVLFISKV